MKKVLLRFSFLAALLCATAIHPPKMRAQYIGTTSPQTVQATLAKNVACTGLVQTFTTGIVPKFDNLGQTQHQATVTSAGVHQLQMEIDGVDNSGNSARISDVLELPSVGGTGQGSLIASGYFPNISVKVTCGAAVGTFTVSYSGTSSTPFVQVGALQLAQLDKLEFSAQPANANATDSFQPPFLNALGTLVFAYSGGSVAGSSLGITCSTAGGSVSATYVFTIANVTTTQYFPIGNIPCEILTVVYGSGGATAASFFLDYIFSNPGTPMTANAQNLSTPLNLVPALVEKGARWGAQTSSPVAGTQATTTKSAGATGVRHLADCVTWSAGAAAAPAATELIINLRDGATGTGTILWQTTVAAGATATQHGSGSFCGLNLIGSPATAMTLEFSASLANESESVALTGYDVQ